MVASGSPARAKRAVVSVVLAAGPERIAGAAGAVVSTFQECWAVGEVCPASSVWRISSVWGPSARPVS